MDFDQWGQPSPKQKQVEDATFRNNLSYLNNLRTTSFTDMQTKRTQTNQAIQASIQASQQEADKYWATGDEMTQGSFSGRAWGKTKNFAGSALDAGSQMLNQGIASTYFKDAMDAKSLVNDEAREAYGRYKQNPFDASPEDMAILERRPEAERGVVRNPRTNMELIEEYNEEMDGARKWLGDARKGEKGKWGTEKYNPYFSDMRDREMKTLNNAVGKKYKPQIEALEKAGDTKGALALAAKMNAEYLGNAVSANTKHNDALIGEAGSLVPYLMGGMVTAVGGAGLQTMEDYIHSSADYEEREGHIATGSDAWKMGGMAALNFGANFIENATPLKALGLAKGVAPKAVLPEAKDAATETAKRSLGEWGADAGKASLKVGGSVLGATAANFAATGLQDSIQKGWGSLTTDGVDSRSFIEAGVAGGLTAGALTAGGHAIGGVATATRAGTDLAKEKIDARKTTYEDTINPESPKFNPAEAIRSQMTEFSKADATEESAGKAYANMEQAVDIAEQQFVTTRDEVQSALAQQDVIIQENQTLIAEYETQLQSLQDPAQIKEFQGEITAMRADITKAEGVKKVATTKLESMHKHANDALDQFEAFTKAQRAQSGKAPTTANIKATTDVVTGKVETATPEVAQDVITQMKNSPQLYSAEALIAASENASLPLTQNERGLFRTLAQRAVELNQSKDDNYVSAEIVKGGKGYRGLDEYVAQMANAVSSGRQRSQDRLLEEIGEFEFNTTNKAQVAQEALRLSKESGEVFQIYKDQVNGQWLINQGEVAINDANRDQLGALDIDADHTGSVRLVGRIDNDAVLIGKTRDALVQMQSVLGAPTQLDLPQTEAPMTESLPPLSLDSDAQSALDHFNDTRDADDLSLSFDNWVPPESDQPTQTQPKGKDTGNVKKQEATPTKSVKRPETKGDSNTDKPSPQRTKTDAESVTPKAESKDDTATPKPPKGQGKLNVLADTTPATRDAERLKDYDEQNLVLVGFEQRTATDGAVNPLVEVKDFLSSLDELDDAEYKATLAKFAGAELTKAQEDHFTNFGKYAMHFSTAFGNSFVRTKSKKFHKEDFLQYLAVNEDGASGIEQNVKVAMAASAFTWFSENGEHPAYNADEIVQGIFHFKNSEGNTVSQDIHQKFAYSQSLSTMASTLGKRAVQALGLRVRSDVDSHFQGRLESALGVHMVYALEHQGVLAVTSITGKEMAELAKGLGPYMYRDWLSQQIGSTLPIDASKYTPEQNTAVHQLENSSKVYGKFVELKRDAEGVPPKLVQRIVESAKAKDGDVGSGAIIGKIFSVVPERKGPSITKIKPMDAKTKIRGSVLAPPSLQRDRINKAIDNPFRVRTETADPIVNMFDNYQDKLFDMLDLHHSEQHLTENFHISQRGSVKSKRQAVIRDLEHGVGFIKGQLTRDDKGEYQHVYLGMNVVRTQRMHVDNNDLNTQANQVHRTLLTPVEYRAEIDVPKLAEGESIKSEHLYSEAGDLTKLGRMFEAVAEHAEELGLKTQGYVGATADKVHPETYLPELLDWYHSAETQAGIKATANLMALTKSGDKVPDSVFRDMSKTVKAMGMGIQSFNGLVSLAELHMAMTDPKAPSTFTTYLRAGSDGKTNGSAIALTQSGTVDASTGTNDMSDGFGLITKASANDPDKGFQNQYEVARSGMGDLYNTINTYQDNRWNQLLASTTFTSSTGDNERLRKTADRMNVLFGDFLQRAKGKTIASPTIYGSGTTAIKINSVNEAVSTIYKKMAKIAQTGKTDPDTAVQQLDVMRKDMNAIFALFNSNFRSIPDGMYGKEGMEMYRTQLEYDYNSRNADAPVDFSGMSDMDFLAKYTGKSGTLNSMWGSAKYRYNRERPNVAPVSLIKDGELSVATLLETELPRDLMLALETVIYNTHGRVHEMALQDAYKDYLAVRDVNIAMSSVAYETYAALKESLVESYIQEGMEPTSEKGLPRIPYKMVDGKKVPLEGLSKKAMEEIDRELYTARPIVVSALSSKSDDPVGTGIMLTDTRSQSLKAEESHVSIRTRSVFGNAKSKEGISKSEVGITAEVDGDPGVRGSVFPVLGTDAYISSAALGSGFATENMHDANYSNLERVGELGRVQNEAFHEITSTYHMQVEMLNMMMRSLDQVAKGTIPISEASRKKIQDALTRLGDKMPVSFADNSLSGFLTGLAEHRYALEAKKLDYLDSLDTVHQYGSWGGEVKLTDAHQKVRDDSRAKLEQDLKTKALGRAKRVGNALEKLFGGEVLEGRKVAEPENKPVTKTERILARGDGKPLDARVAIKALRKEVVTSASGRQLLDVLEGILPDGLTINLINDQVVPEHVDTSYQKGKSMLDAGASGWYSPKANQINILDSTSANSRVGGELLMHELLHAGLSNGIALAQSGKGTQAMRDAVDRLEGLRADVVASLKGTAREAEFKEATANIDELVSWGMTNPTFQKYLASTTVERKGRKVVSMFKDFVSSALDLVFGHDRPRASNRKHIPAYEALIMDMASLSSEITALKGAELAMTQEAKPMISGQERAKQRATQASPRDIFRSLDGQNNSREFTQRVETMMDTVIETVITRAGREHLKDGLTQIADRAVDARSAGFALNDREAYAVEAFEVVIDTALDNGAGSNVMKVMHKAYEEARKAMTPQSFHKGDWTHATAQDRALAQAKFDYIFKAKATGGRNTTIARFASMALGSEQMSQLLNFKPSVEAGKPTTPYGKLLKAFDYAVAWTNNWMAGTHRAQTVSAKVDALVNRIAQIDTRSRNIAVERFSAGFDWMTAKMGSLNPMSAKAIGKLGQFEFVRNSKYAVVRAVGQSARLAVSDKIDNIPGALRDLRNHENPGTRYGVTAEILNEFGSAQGFAKGLQKLLRGTKEIEKARAAVKSSVKTIVDNGFSRKLTPEESKAVAYGLLRSDAHTLMDTYSAQDLQGLVAQKLKREKAIGQAQVEVMRLHPQGNAMINKAKQLAWYMQSGNPTAGLVMNAQAIAQGLGTSNFVELRTADPKLVTALDKLASLWSIEYMDGDSRKVLAQVMSQELGRKDGVNGFENALRVHKQLSADAMEHRFKDNPLSAIKGWVPEINNPYVETRIDVVSNGEKLEAQGWVKVAELSQDSNDPVKHTQAMYSREGGYQRRVSTVMSLTDTHTKGMIVTDQGMSQAVTASQAHLVKQVELTNHVTYDPRGDQNTQLFATYDTLGNVMHHSYRMNNNARDELLQRKHEVGELLGEYAGSSLDKTYSPAQNIRTIDALHADYLTNFTKNPRAYVAIGPFVADRGAQELWRLMPHDTRKAMEDTWGKNEPMYIRNDLVSLVFGYRKLALGNIWNKQQQERNFAERMYTTIMEGMFKDKAQLRSYQVGRATSEIVSTAKDFIVLRTPAVLMGNMTFNSVLLTALGVNPVNAMRDGMLAFKAGKAYQDDRKELLEIEVQLRSGVGDTAKLEQRLAVLQDSMARNPLKAFIESGTMPAIVDDVEATNDDFGYKTALASKASELTSYVPDTAKNVGKTLMMSPGTVGHNFMSAATQYSDFIGRYIAYKHFTEKDGMSHDAAVHEAMETFINYDLPSSAQVQWLNDVGAMLFTKFLFRYQRVMLALLRKNPALVMTQSMALGAMTSMETVLDPNLLSKGLGVINPGPIILPSAVMGSGVLGVAL